ncbi:hypothetical protein PENSPDRAFT_760453 [Peniophora sp. CONT]|nr:hypothetical protein PENSPDRAFT_760453 [Peniophora sp. CONT]
MTEISPGISIPVCPLGADVTVVRNGASTAIQFPPFNIRAGVIKDLRGRSVLGAFVWTALEDLVDVFTGEISYYNEIEHGELSRVRHSCLLGTVHGFLSIRHYHFLCINTARSHPSSPSPPSPKKLV